MKKRNKQSGRVSLWDLLIIVLFGVLAYLLYFRGHLDRFLPEQYASATVLQEATGPETNEVPPPARVRIDLGTVSRRYWPTSIKLRRTMDLPIFKEGKQIGSIQATEGMDLPLVEVRAREVVVKLGDGEQTIAAGDTDVLERIHQIVKATTSTTER